MQSRIPFSVAKTESFYDKLGDWIGDLFYEILPDSGFELRDEQIFMAFQLEKAFKEKKVMFAEAGVGTGKTIAYLLYAIIYARYTNRPSIIACADENLIEQLVKDEGDIAKLERILDLKIDVRLAKSRDQYLCLKKLERAKNGPFAEEIKSVYDRLPRFVFQDVSMQKFTRYGDRKEFPDLSDEVWAEISWDPLQDCFSCDMRQRCGLTLNREYYRHAKDLIICSHDFYMEHIWTKESRKREGQLPLLPEHSSVIFDEGHLLEFACQKALSYRISEQTLETLLTRLMENDVREETLQVIEEILVENDRFFDALASHSSKMEESNKKFIEKHPSVINNGKNLLFKINQLEEELVFDSELYVINDYDLKIVEEFLDQISHSLRLFLQTVNGVVWFEEKDGERTLVIMPKMVKEVLQDEVFSQKKPFIFSSATLSNKGSFDYLAKSLGIENYLSFSVASPFSYEERMEVYLPQFNQGNNERKCEYIMDQIVKSEGRALVLVPNRKDLDFIKQKINSDTRYPFFFEGDGEISTVVSQFQKDEHAVLFSTSLWEGLDIPGRSLENVLIYSLPFPPNDPVFKAKKDDLQDPFMEVDLPFMLLRLRQGMGRLIRNENDKGTIHILLDTETPQIVVESIKEILPVEPK